MVTRRVYESPPFGSDVEVAGVLGAVGWATDFRVTRVALFASERNVYEIEIDATTAEMTKLLCKAVVVRGIVSNNEHGAKSLVVTAFWSAAP